MTSQIPGDPVRDLLALMAELEPSLDAGAVLAALGRAAAVPAGQRRVARAVTGDPGLLTGQGAGPRSRAFSSSSASLPLRARPRWPRLRAPATAGR